MKYFTCWANRPSYVDVEIVRRINWHIEIFVGLKNKQHEDKKINK